MLRHKGHIIDKYVNLIVSLQKVFLSFSPLMFRLAICASLEHYTSSMSLVAMKNNKSLVFNAN